MAVPGEGPEAASTRHAPGAFLRLEGITKRYGGLTVVDRLTLDVAQGEFVSLLGPSGCGKTTTLHVLAGFIEPDGGRILLEGHSIERLPSHRRNAAMVFQNYALFPHMTVFENIAFGLRMQKRPQPEIDERVREAMELVRLPSFEQRYPKELSGGQQQRVALARAVVLRPQLLLLDEPLSNLDAKLRKDLREEFIEIHRRTGTTTIFVTHDLEEAFMMADRVAVMNQGRLEQYGTPQEIFSAPGTAFVADFIGHVNVIEGPIRAGPDGSTVLEVAGMAIRVPPSRRPRAVARYAIPETAISVSARRTGTDNVFSAEIRRLSFFGAVTRVRLGLGGLDLHAELGTSAATTKLREGNAVEVSWSSADMIEIATDET